MPEWVLDNWPIITFLITGIVGVTAVITTLRIKSKSNENDLDKHVDDCEKRYTEIKSEFNEFKKDTKEDFRHVHTKLDMLITKLIGTNPPPPA